MKKLVLLLSLSLFAMPALAATTQQEKIKTACNAKAKGLKGDEYKKVRNECLKAHRKTAAGPATKRPNRQPKQDPQSRK